MRITDALLGEHGVIYALFDHVEAALPAINDLGSAKALAATVSAAVLSHAKVEDELLFPALEPHLGPMGPLAVMRQDHKEIDSILESIPNSESLDDVLEQLETLTQVARDHFAKEEHALFNMARQALSEDELEALGAQWSRMRKVLI
jgi:hemerythrin-like domain-containing protein